MKAVKFVRSESQSDIKGGIIIFNEDNRIDLASQFLSLEDQHTIAFSKDNKKIENSFDNYIASVEKHLEEVKRLKGEIFL